MTAPPLKARLRRLVVWSAGAPPLGAAYRAAYRLLIRAAAAAVGRFASVRAIYLTRGCAKDEITPGLSDIDLVVVLDDDRERPAVLETLRRLHGLSAGVVDFYPKLVPTRAMVTRRWRSAPAWQYRYLEGQANWRLLQGEDVLAALPPLSEAQRRTACWIELTRWWSSFAANLLATRQNHDQDVVRNSVCCKAVAESLDVARALATGEHGWSRGAALARDGSPLARRLAALAARRYLGADDPMNDSLAFLLRLFGSLWDGFAARPFLTVDPAVTQALDGGPAPLDAGERRYADELGRAAGGRAVRVLRSAFWDLDERLAIVDADPAAAPPTVAALCDLVDAHRGAAAGRPIHLFWRAGAVGFPLTPSLPRDLHRGLLTAATMPDLFLQLGHAPVHWTDYTRWYLCDWEENEQWPDPPAAKRRQLAEIAAGAAAGRVLYRFPP